MSGTRQALRMAENRCAIQMLCGAAEVRCLRVPSQRRWLSGLFHSECECDRIRKLRNTVERAETPCANALRNACEMNRNCWPVLA